ncbi:MAG: hypothetical protein Ct9H300mP10_10620 [Methanobacteriota archaeon]|nr:MAG: hypothetical protein Ct9H300mP10_10620 [Euryarchaeota archaeon]
MKIKRTYKGLVIQPHYIVRPRHNLPETIVVPVGQLGQNNSETGRNHTEMLDEEAGDASQLPQTEQ